MYLHSDTKLYHDILLWICRTDLRMSCTTTFFCGYVVRTSKCHAPRHSSVDMSYGLQNVMHHDILLWICRTDLKMSCTTTFFCGYVVRTSECHAPRHSSVDMSYGPQNVMHDFLWICRTDLRMSCTTFCGYVVRTSECHARLSVDKSYGRHIHRVPYLHSDTTFHHKFLLWKYRTDLRSPANTSYGPQNVMHHDILWVCRTDDISIV